jgi:hypothetical protein
LQLKDNEHKNLLHSFVLSVSFLFAFLLISPNLAQSLFWWNGARSYSSPMMFLTLFSFFLYYVINQHKINLNLVYILSFVIFFLIAGMSEIYAIGQAGLLLFLIFLTIINKKGDSKAQLGVLDSGLVGTFLSLLVIFIAPGNSVRHTALFPPFI